MAVTQKVLQSATGVSIDRFVVIAGTRNSIGLELQMLEMNIFEDIFSPSMSATVLVQDTFNLIEKIPICGQEWVFIRISKPGFEAEDGNDLSFSFLMRIYKIEKVNHESPLKQTYLMHLIKEDAVFSAQDRVNKSYKTTKPEVAIKDIFKNNFFYDDEDSFLQSFATWPMKSSNYAFSFQIPNLKPFEAIQFLSSMARNKNNINDYIFFENNRGYVFDSLSEMFVADPILTIEYRVKNIVTDTVDSTDPYVNSLSPLGIQNDVLFDYLKSLDHGELGVQADSFQLHNQTFMSNSISYDTFFSKYKKDFKLNKFSKIPDNDWRELITSQDASRIPYYRVFSVIPKKNAGLFTDFSEEAIATRVMQFSSITNQKIRLHMPGTPLMKAGATIQLQYPAIESKSTSDNAEELLDDYLAAKYLILSVRHVITQKEWHSYAEISKDTLPKKLPMEFASNFTLEGL